MDLLATKKRGFINKLIAKLLVLSLLLLSGMLSAQPKVILKLDDIGVKNNRCSAEPVLNILLKRKIKAGIGVIAKQLDETTSAAMKKYLDATNSNGEKLIEIWNHGYDHSSNRPPNNAIEFSGTSYQFQKQHLAMADSVVKKLTGVQMHTFGAPNNASDSTCFRVLAENGNYRAFMLNKSTAKQTNGIFNFNNRVSMETATGKVDYDFFVSNYEKLKSVYPDYIVMQGHPNMWNADRLAQFSKILDYLEAQHVEFVLPYTYSLSLK